MFLPVYQDLLTESESFVEWQTFSVQEDIPGPFSILFFEQFLIRSSLTAALSHDGVEPEHFGRIRFCRNLYFDRKCRRRCRCAEEDKS